MYFWVHTPNMEQNGFVGQNESIFYKFDYGDKWHNLKQGAYIEMQMAIKARCSPGLEKGFEVKQRIN